MTHISQINSHIEDYLDYYTNLSQSPKFAILLKGKWGSGKSWFINKYIDKKKSENIKPLYVSLYGVNSFSQIEDSLLEQISPFWNSKGMKIAGKLGKGLLKGTLKLDLDGDNKDDGNWSFSIPDIEQKFKIKDSDFSLLIFDDLERCSLEIENILGYINTFVESQDLKVIIIANEEELEKKYEKKEDELNKYRRVKEKLIGKTFEILDDPESALKDFIQFVESEDLKQFLRQDDIYKRIEELYINGKHKNLRTLQQIIFDFQRIFEKLPEKVQKNKLLLTDILTSLVVLSIEISKGELSIQEIITIGIEARSYFFLNDHFVKVIDWNKQTREQKNKTYDELKELQRQEKLYQDYQSTLGQYYFDNFIPSLKWWQDFFDKGIVEQKELDNLVCHTKYFPDSNIPEWLKLYELINVNYRDISDEEFDKLLDDVKSKYESREYDNLIVIKCLICSFLCLHDRGLYPQGKQNIIDDGQHYIDDLINSGKFNYNDILYNTILINSINYITIDFYGRETTEFQKFDHYIQKRAEEIRRQKAPEEAKELLEIMSNDINEFDSMINISSHFDLSLKAQQLGTDNIKMPEKVYKDFPIFAYMNGQDFMNIFLKLPQSNRLDIIYSLKKRYENLSEDKAKILSKELDFLNKVKKILENEIKERKSKLSGYLLSSILVVFNSLIYSERKQYEQ